MSFPTKSTLHSLKPALLNCPALSMKVLDKLSYKLIEQAAVVWSSQKTDRLQQGSKDWGKQAKIKKKSNIQVGLEKLGKNFGFQICFFQSVCWFALGS